MRRKLSMYIIFVALFLFLAACSNSTSTTEQQEGGGDVNESNGEMTELNVAFYITGEPPRDMKLVEEKVNELTKEKINATVKLMPIALGDYTQQMNLILSGNEQLDLAVTSGRMGFTGRATRGQLLELDDLLEEFGQDIKNVMDEEILNAPRLNGKLFGIPTNRDLAGSVGFNMRTDLVEKHNIDLESVKTMGDLEEVLRTIKENEPGVEPLLPFNVAVPHTNVVSWFDNLGDFFGVLPNDSDNLEVVNLYETDEYKEFVSTMRRWYTEGLILSDITTTTESRSALLTGNKSFGWFGPQKPGVEGQESRGAGVSISSVSLGEPISYTHHATGVMWSIPRNSGDPEKAMQFLNLMYVDEELVNLLNWGIEGEHYVFNNDNLVTYPEGVDGSNNGYRIAMSYLWGDSFLTYIAEGDEPTLWEDTRTFNENATKSKALGFIFDPTPVSSELTALDNVKNEYAIALETGVMDPETHLPEFIQRLKDAGIDKYIEEKQRQLDEWAKNN
ncbi:ABC transporter substrate-binding protein [Alkalihalobacillus sp. MEB130]|uniref:ABC transporter substrate-binding protein n=1 Tax=Alkalihalobacillus sp. MEB130 TaxID=2976704 RepID=UPI0028DF6205|nr:ABC transporter substrate-binding protein [Alkalihalobacillus sp. MEB130]MDT8860207.1 ABC transporter substrate-binding protein [Alkalihalobacillus sp. MEB130]